MANRVSLASNIGAPRLIPINDYAQGAVAARRVTRDEVRREMLDASSNAWRNDPILSVSAASRLQARVSVAPA